MNKDIVHHLSEYMTLTNLVDWLTSCKSLYHVFSTMIWHECVKYDKINHAHARHFVNVHVQHWKSAYYHQLKHVRTLHFDCHIRRDVRLPKRLNTLIWTMRNTESHVIQCASSCLIKLIMRRVTLTVDLHISWHDQSIITFIMHENVAHAFLPRSLKKLVIRDTFVRVHVNERWPSSLTHLHVANLLWHIPIHFPKSIISLQYNLSHTPQILLMPNPESNDDSVKYFSRHLQRFTMRGANKITLSDLPLSLTHVNIYHAIKALPAWQNLITLSLHRYDEPLTCSLPSSLIRLTLIDYNHDYSFDWPSQLQYLHLQRFNKIIQYALPNSITCLRLNGIQSYNFDWPIQIEYLELQNYTWLQPTLPHTLRVLRLRDCQAKIPIWPDRLRELTIHQCKQVFDMPWPESLEKLVLMHFNQKFVHDLPRHLIILKMPTYHHALSLPASLKYLQLGTCHALTLPSKLEIVELSQCEHAITWPNTLKYIHIHKYDQPINCLPNQLISLSLTDYTRMLPPLPDTLKMLRLPKYNHALHGITNQIESLVLPMYNHPLPILPSSMKELHIPQIKHDVHFY